MSTTFYTLNVKDIKRETADTVSISFDVPADLKDKFQFIPGQYLTLKTDINGEEVRRSYSICTAPFDGELTVSVKEIENGKLEVVVAENFLEMRSNKGYNLMLICHLGQGLQFLR